MAVAAAVASGVSVWGAGVWVGWRVGTGVAVVASSAAVSAAMVVSVVVDRGVFVAVGTTAVELWLLLVAVGAAVCSGCSVCRAVGEGWVVSAATGWLVVSVWMETAVFADVSTAVTWASGRPLASVPADGLMTSGLSVEHPVIIKKRSGRSMTVERKESK